jgi:uncharacterized membrane protein
MVSKKRKHKGPKVRPKPGPAIEHRPTKPGVEARPVAPGLLAWCNRWGLFVVIALALAYAAVFCAISHFKYRHFNYSDFDLAIFSNAMWNTAHGHFMFTEIRAGCYFKDHVPAILLLLVPLYRLSPSPLTLLYAQSVMLGAAAVPLFLLARRELNGLWGILFALMLLLYPAVGFINLFEFHALAFVPVLLLFTLYFFQAKRYVPFLVLAALTMLCREEVALTVMMIGLYALIARRRWPWIVAPAAAGLAWFVICLYVIIPHFNQGENIFGRLYGEMGSTPAEVMKNVITKPGKALRVALEKDPQNPMVNKPMYLQKVFAPVSYLPLANPEALVMAGPQFALNLLVDTRRHLSPPTIYFQYTATLIPLLFFASVLGVKRLLRVRVLKQFWFVPAAGVLMLSAITWILWSPQVAPGRGARLARSFAEKLKARNPANTQVYRRDDVAQYRQMLDAMPAQVPVVATFRFLGHLTNRRVLTSFHYIYTGREKVAAERPRTLPDDVSYALLDLNYGADWTGFATPDQGEHFFAMLDAGDWGIEKRRGQLVLLRKQAPELPKLIRKIEGPNVTNRFTCDYSAVIRLQGVDAQIEDLGAEVQVRLRSDWELLMPLPGPLKLTYALIGRDGRFVEVREGLRPSPVSTTAEVANYAASPSAWQAGDWFESEHALLIPGQVPNGEYALGVVAVPAGFQPASASESSQGDRRVVTLSDARGRGWQIALPAARYLGGGFCFVTQIKLGKDGTP